MHVWISYVFFITTQPSSSTNGYDQPRWSPNKQVTLTQSHCSASKFTWVINRQLVLQNPVTVAKKKPVLYNNSGSDNNSGLSNTHKSITSSDLTRIKHRTFVYSIKQNNLSDVFFLLFIPRLWNKLARVVHIMKCAMFTFRTLMI